MAKKTIKNPNKGSDPEIHPINEIKVECVPPVENAAPSPLLPNPTVTTALTDVSKPKAQNNVPFSERLAQQLVTDNSPDVKLVKKGTYKEAYQILEDAQACNLTPILIGPPGTGKTLLARSFAVEQGRDFEWMTCDDATKSAHFIGVFDPAETIHRGFTKESFIPGPLTKMMVTGGIFLANELNRATEFTQNTLLEPLEERTIMIPRLGRIRSSEGFFLIAAANPGDMAGTHRLSEALKDRIKVWIQLDYPERSVELEIIKNNVPQCKLPNDFMDTIYNLIDATRKSRDIERPASVRSAIALAKLVGRRFDLQKNVSVKEFKTIAQMVLAGGIKARPGIDADQIIRQIVNSVTKL